MEETAEKHPIQFFTAPILEWKRLLKPDKYKDIIIESLRYLNGSFQLMQKNITIQVSDFMKKKVQNGIF